MRKERIGKHSPTGEYAVMAALLSVYALAIFLCPDPEWVVWAGQMSVGVIDPAAMPPAMPEGTVEALRTASSLSALGLLAVVVLVAAGLGIQPGWFARLAGHGVAGHDPGGEGTGHRA